MSAALVPVHAGPLGLFAPPDIRVECDVFEGSLATLVRCVLNHKLDLLQIPLQPIVEAYVEYLMACEDTDIDSACAALLALAYLIERKAHCLLPKPEIIETDDLDAFEGPGVETYRAVLGFLEDGLAARDEVFFRSARADYELPVEMGKVTLSGLARALERLLEQTEDPGPALLSRPRRSIAQQMEIVLESLMNEPQTLDNLIPAPMTRTEAVWWFLALLELIRTHAAQAEQTEQGVLFFWKAA